VFQFEAGLKKDFCDHDAGGEEAPAFRRAGCEVSYKARPFGAPVVRLLSGEWLLPPADTQKMTQCDKIVEYF